MKCSFSLYKKKGRRPSQQPTEISVRQFCSILYNIDYQSISVKILMHNVVKLFLTTLFFRTFFFWQTLFFEVFMEKLLPKVSLLTLETRFNSHLKTSVKDLQQIRYLIVPGTANLRIKAKSISWSFTYYLLSQADWKNQN